MQTIAPSLLRRTTRGLVVSLLIGTPCVAAHAQAENNPYFEVFGAVIVWAVGDASMGGYAPIIGDFVIDSSQNSITADDHDLIIGNVHTVQTGTLMPVPGSLGSSQGAPMELRNLAVDPNFTTDTDGSGNMTDQDSFSAFSITANSDIRSQTMELNNSFYIASNVPFAIEGVATAAGSSTNDDIKHIRATLSITQSGNDGLAFGSASQLPNSNGPTAGTYLTNRRLHTLLTPKTVFTGNQRTAIAPGTIAEQSVRFDLSYRYKSGNADLSDGTFDIEAEVTYTVYVP